MQPPPLSQTQGCLRLQSVYRAHRTRRCVLHRSRSDFERILIELEPEPCSRPRVLFPHPFMCRPQIERSAAAEAIATASAKQNHASPLLVSLSSSAAPSVCPSALHTNGSSHASTSSSRAASPSPSAPASPSASCLTRNVSAAATATANVLPEVIPSSACVDDGSNVPSLQLCSHNQQQHTERRSSTFCDAAVQSTPPSFSSTTADACVGDDHHPPSTSFQGHVSHNSRGCMRGHHDPFDDGGRLQESSCNSSFSQGSCEVSQSFNSLPPHPSAEQDNCSEHRFFLLFHSQTLTYPSQRAAATHLPAHFACTLTSTRLPPFQTATAAPALSKMTKIPSFVTASASQQTPGSCMPRLCNTPVSHPVTASTRITFLPPRRRLPHPIGSPHLLCLSTRCPRCPPLHIR